MTAVIFCLNLLSIAAGLVSAFLWWRSARIDTKQGITYLDGPPKEVYEAMQKQTRYNANAALCTAVAILLQATSLALSTFLPGK